MNELQIFSNEEFGEVRTITRDNKTYFAGSDVAKALGYAIPHKAVQTHCKGVLKWNIPTNSGNQDVLFITEGDIYRLIMKSKLPSAERFESWVMDEVLPSIRKTGSYNKPMTTMEKIQLLAQGNEELNERVDIVEEKVTGLENNMTIDYGQQVAIGYEVNKVVINALGGKRNRAYKEMSKKVFAECNRDIKHYFHVNARNNVPKKRFDEAIQYIQNWHPCTNTQMMINMYNSSPVEI